MQSHALSQSGSFRKIDDLNILNIPIIKFCSFFDTKSGKIECSSSMIFRVRLLILLFPLVVPISSD